MGHSQLILRLSWSCFIGLRIIHANCTQVVAVELTAPVSFYYHWVSHQYAGYSELNRETATRDIRIKRWKSYTGYLELNRGRVTLDNWI